MLTFLLLTLLATVVGIYLSEVTFKAVQTGYPQLSEMTYAPKVTVNAGWYRQTK